MENLALEDGELSTVAGRAGRIAADLDSDGALTGVEDAVGSAMPGSRARRNYTEAVEALNERVADLVSEVTDTAENTEFAEIDLLSQDQNGVTRLFPWNGMPPGPTP